MMTRWTDSGSAARSAPLTPRGRTGTRGVECGDACPARRAEVRRLEPRRRGPDPARREADRARAGRRRRPRRRRLGDGRHDGRAAEPGRRDHGAAGRARARHAARDRRAPERDARLDGAPRARRQGDQPERAAGRHHDRRPLRQGPDREHRTGPRPARARRGQGRDRRRLPGPRGRRRGRRHGSPRRRHHDARPRRQRHDRRRPGRPPRRRPLPDLHRRPRHLHRGSRASPRPPASSTSSATRRCSSSPTRAPRSCRPGPSSSAGSTTSSSRSSARSRTPPARSSRRTRSWSSGTRFAAWPTTGTSPRSRSSRSRTSPAWRRAVFEPLADAGINVDMIVQNIGHGGATDLSFTIPQVELAKAKRILDPVARELDCPRDDDRLVGRQDLDRRRRDPERARATRPGCSRRSPTPSVNIEMISTSEIRITTIIAEDALETAVRALHAGVRARAAGGDRSGRGRVTLTEAPPFIGRHQRFAVVGSTNDVVRSWLAAGEPEVCLAVADEQTAGRGREGRTWTAPPGSALLLSRSASDRPGSSRAASGSWPRSSAWRWPRRRRSSPTCRPGRFA